MRMNIFRKLAIGVLLAASTGAAVSADLYSVTQSYCIAGDASQLDVYDDTRLRAEVVRLMDEAVAVADSDRWIGSSRPAFVWANETKAACGKAYGYLQSNVRDADYLSKCACFHDRMVRYMN